MAIDKKTVEYVAHLARIDLEANELEKLSKQLPGILDFIDKLKSLNLDNVAPTTHALALSNVLRQDSGAESLSSEKVLMNAPLKEGKFFVVPKVIE